MIDLSSLVAWTVPICGGIVAAKLGLRNAAAEVRPSGLNQFVSAVLLGVALTFLQVFLHSLCIESLHLCKSRGDGNMTYWFQSFFSIPAYWLLLFIFGSKQHGASLVASACDTSVIAALTQYRQSEKVTQLCPECSTLISVSASSVKSNQSKTTVNTLCKCGKCNGEFTLDLKRS